MDPVSRIKSPDRVIELFTQKYDSFTPKQSEIIEQLDYRYPFGVCKTCGNILAHNFLDFFILICSKYSELPQLRTNILQRSPYITYKNLPYEKVETSDWLKVIDGKLILSMNTELPQTSRENVKNEARSIINEFNIIKPSNKYDSDDYVEKIILESIQHDTTDDYISSEDALKILGNRLCPICRIDTWNHPQNALNYWNNAAKKRAHNGELFSFGSNLSFEWLKSNSPCDSMTNAIRNVENENMKEDAIRERKEPTEEDDEDYEPEEEEEDEGSYATSGEDEPDFFAGEEHRFVDEDEPYYDNDEDEEGSTSSDED